MNEYQTNRIKQTLLGLFEHQHGVKVKIVKTWTQEEEEEQEK